MTPNLHAVNLDIELADIASSGDFEAGVLQRVKTWYVHGFCAICSATLVTVSSWRAPGDVEHNSRRVLQLNYVLRAERFKANSERFATA